MKRTVKTSLAILLALTMLVTAGCGGTATPAASDSATPKASESTVASESASATAEATPASAKMYGGVDITNPVDIVYYHLGDTPKDMQQVLDYVNNTYLVPKVNAKLSVLFLPWSDWKTKYSLTLAGGDQVDLMYTSDWAYYSQEAAKGAFLEITDDFVAKNMPLTKEKQVPESWGEVKIGGKMFAIPQSKINHNDGMVVIRDDLRLKYNLPEPKSIDEWENYLFTIADKEKSIIAYNASKDNDSFNIFYNQDKSKVDIGYDFSYDYKGDTTIPSVDEIRYQFFDPDYISILKRMKTWAEKGVFPKNALNNDIQVRDSLQNGKSAALSWNFTVYSAGKQMRLNNAEWVPGYYDLTPNGMHIPMKYSNDCIAIAAVSKNPERAAAVLDVMKFDPDAGFALRAGLENIHWKASGTSEYTEITENTPNYLPDAWTWGIRPTQNYFEGLVPGFRKLLGDGSPEQIQNDEMIKKWTAVYKNPPLRAFRFDETAVKNELAAVNALRDQYMPALRLGMAGDVDAKVAEFKKAAEDAGLIKITDEFKAQLGKYIAENYK